MFLVIGYHTTIDDINGIMKFKSYKAESFRVYAKITLTSTEEGKKQRLFNL